MFDVPETTPLTSPASVTEYPSRSPEFAPARIRPATPPDCPTVVTLIVWFPLVMARSGHDVDGAAVDRGTRAGLGCTHDDVGRAVAEDVHPARDRRAKPAQGG